MIRFLEFTEKNLHNDNEIFWRPYNFFRNMQKHPRDDIFHHCGCDGIIQNYTKWVCHAKVTRKRPTSHRVKYDEFMNDTLEFMICDIIVDVFKKVHVEDTLKNDMEESLYPGCKNIYKIFSCVKTI